MKWLTEFVLRLKHEPPDFFKVLSLIAGWCTVITGLPVLLVQFETDNFQLPEWVHVIVVKAALISAALLWLFSKLPNKDNVKSLPYTSKKNEDTK